MHEDFFKAWGVNIAEKMHIYYDESNNCRKFWLDKMKQNFNTFWYKDFVLAGVAVENEIDISLDEIISRFSLQKNIKELKAKKIYKGKDFLGCLNSNAMADLLDLIDDYGLYIHYKNVNNFFYTIVEILDSITTPSEIIEFGFDYFRLKAVLYNVLSENIKNVIKIMIKYSYPNIKNDDINDFCTDLLSVFKKRTEQNVEEKFLAGMLKRAASSKSLLFIQNNKDFVTQDNYAEFYFESIIKFPQSFHHFDEELSIQNELENYLKVNQCELIKYEFLKSEKCTLIQISDLVAGLFGKMFAFINITPRKNFKIIIGEMTDFQLKNAVRFDDIRVRSNNKNKGFLHSMTSIFLLENLEDFFLKTKCEAKKRKLI